LAISTIHGRKAHRIRRLGLREVNYPECRTERDGTVSLHCHARNLTSGKETPARMPLYNAPGESPRPPLTHPPHRCD